MNIVEINLSACGYYSDAEYNENIVITKESYDIIKDDISEICCYISELDGKHSEVEGNIEITQLDEDSIKMHIFNSDNGSQILYYELADIFNRYDISLDGDIAKVQEYIESIDGIVEILIKVKKSDVKKVLDFCENIN